MTREEIEQMEALLAKAKASLGDNPMKNDNTIFDDEPNVTHEGNKTMQRPRRKDGTFAMDWSGWMKLKREKPREFNQGHNQMQMDRDYQAYLEKGMDFFAKEK